MRRRFLLTAALLAGVQQTACADEPINGIAIGTPLAALVQTRGGPATVASDDSGNRFVLRDGITAYADDDGRVLAVSLGTGEVRIAIEGAPRTFEIGSYSAARADAELADVAEFSTPTLRSYRLAPRRDLVLGFSAAQQLIAVTYGEPGQLARLGLLPGDPSAKAISYRAPRMRAAVADTGGALATVYRIAVDRAGAVSSVDILLASPAPEADADIAAKLRSAGFTPGNLDGRPIAATVFLEVRH